MRNLVGREIAQKIIIGWAQMAEKNFDVHPRNRIYRLDLKRCIVQLCGGELTELSYYERNNWVTVEYKCNRCSKEFTVKIEA